MNSPIGILDSGVGGLTVWREIVRELPHESTVYIADSKNTPYGAKNPEEIYRLAKRLIQFLLRRQAKIIVVACNTITVSCLEQLRREYPTVPLIGTVPVVKTAAVVSKNKRIGILSTTRTAESEYQKYLIKEYASDCDVTNIGTDILVPLIERGNIESVEMKQSLQEILTPFIQKRVDTIALGCTHYPFIEPGIQDVMGKDVHLLDSGGAIARQVHRILDHNQLLSEHVSPVYSFFTTGDSITAMIKLLSVLKINEVVSEMPHITKLEQESTW